MPNMPHGDRIRELEMAVASLSAHQDALDKAVLSLTNAHKEIVEKLDDFRRESERKIAILEEKIVKQEKVQNNAADRLWSIIPPVAAAVIAALLTWLLMRQ